MSKKETCEACGGTGQISYFKGVSRFLLSSEECTECAGFGYVMSEDNDGKESDSADDKKKGSGRDKKKK